MKPLLLLALLAQAPTEEPEEVHVCVVETIEVNTYTDYGGKPAVQLVFWEQDRWDQFGKRWAVFKGCVQYRGEGLTAEKGEFVYRGHNIEMRGKLLMFSDGYDAERSMEQFMPTLQFPICFRWW